MHYSGAYYFPAQRLDPAGRVPVHTAGHSSLPFVEIWPNTELVPGSELLSIAFLGSQTNTYSF